jgi:hypothetical protein
MNKQTYLRGFCSKMAQEQPTRIGAYGSGMLPFGSMVYGANKAGPGNRLSGVGSGFVSGLAGGPLGGLAGTAVGAGAGAAGGSLAALIALLRKRPDIARKLLGYGVAGGSGVGAVGGSLIGQGEMNYRLLGGKQAQVR